MYVHYLRDDGESSPEVLQAQLGDVHTIDENAAFCRLNETEQAVCEAGLTRSGSAHDADLRPRGKVTQ